MKRKIRHSLIKPKLEEKEGQSRMNLPQLMSRPFLLLTVKASLNPKFHRQGKVVFKLFHNAQSIIYLYESQWMASLVEEIKVENDDKVI